MRKGWKIALAAVGVAVLAGSAEAGSDDRSSRERNPGHGARNLAKVYSGEVVVRSDENHVTIAVDEARTEGQPDGIVDHVFSLWTPQPFLGSLALVLRDASADVEFRPDRIRVLLHTEERELQFLMYGTDLEPRPQRSIYTLQSYPDIVQFSEYSGEVAGRFSLAEIQRDGKEILPALTSSTIRPFNPAPEPDVPGSSCVATCSKSCAFGSCTASCIPGHCAKCSCYGDPPAIWPSCSCV